MPSTSLTPTEQVRAKLDNHGVEWSGGCDSNATIVKTRDGNEFELYEGILSDKFFAFNLTPEQAARIAVFLA